ncbi:DUF6090 family protein [Polaribacter sp. Z014]|uniref:DUF6090 family protein n=1 Tax=Polaribacter sp. Z014 TaxID=2927126 RepID=UPI0020227FFA|nr:DUF6090 family protein [Polaribacter sp. Z014]MCL7765498.1 DUF6090 family protein [Polaribacter sp. Z014]
MIKLFKKKRYESSKKKELPSYIKYALGEIILVVIGILIALWINSSYYDYKNNEIKMTYLIDFKKDLVADTTEIIQRIKGNEYMTKNIDSIFISFQSKKELNKEELMLFIKYNYSLLSESYFIPKKNTLRQYESNNNFNFSKTLKDKLFEYYTLNDRNEKNTETSVQLYQHNFFSRDITNLIVQDLYNVSIGIESKLTKDDLNRIKTNKDYLSTLLLKKKYTLNQNRNYNNIKLKAKEALKVIDRELEK